MIFPNREIVAALRAEYPAGTRVKLLKMDDIQAPPIGTLGTVSGIDVSWFAGITALVCSWFTVKMSLKKYREYDVAFLLWLSCQLLQSRYN